MDPYRSHASILQNACQRSLRVRTQHAGPVRNRLHKILITGQIFTPERGVRGDCRGIIRIAFARVRGKYAQCGFVVADEIRRAVGAVRMQAVGTQLGRTLEGPQRRE